MSLFDLLVVVVSVVSVGWFGVGGLVGWFGWLVRVRMSGWFARCLIHLVWVFAR